MANLVAVLSAKQDNFAAGFEGALQTVAKFEKTVANSASSLTAHSKKISAAFKDVSGDRLIESANALVSAVTKVGGASRLTETEQAKVNRTVTDAIAKYAALGQQAPKAMQDLALATGKLEQQSTLASKAAGFLSSTFAQFTAANLAARAIQVVGARMGEFVEQGKKLSGLQNSFFTLAGTVKQSGAVMLESMGAATKGLVSEFDLMQSANKAILLGLPVTATEMGELAKSATALGRAMGLDATQALDNLITALGRSSPLILDNLGLTVKVGEANEAYARKLGKTVQQLTDAESKMAFYEAAMEAARKKTIQLGDQTKTLGEIIETVWVGFGNKVSGAVSGINVAVGRALSSLQGFGDFLDNVLKTGSIGAAIALGQMRDQLESLNRARKAGLGQDVNLAVPGAEDAAKKAAEATKQLSEAQTKAAQAADAHARAIQALREDLGGAGLMKAARDTVEALRGLPPVAQLTREALDKIHGTMDKAIDAAERLGKTVPAEWRRIRSETIDMAAVMTAKIGTEIPAALAKLGAVVKPEIDRIIQLYGILEKESSKVVTGLANLKLPGAIDVSKLIPATMPATLAQQLFGTGAEMGVALGNAIQGAIQGGGNVIASAAASLGQHFTSQFAKHLTLSKEAGGAGIGGFLGGAISAVLPGLGSLMGPLVGKIQSLLADAFGGPSKGELQGRSIVEAFESQLTSGLSASTKLAAGNESWKLTTIAVRDAYVAAGKTAAEAEAAVAKLWASSRSGAKAAELAVLEIQAVMEQVTGKQGEMAAANTAMVTANSAAVEAVKGRIGELTSEYDSLFNSIKNEAPEEVMGVVERNTRARMEQVAKERSQQESELSKLTKAMEKSFDAVAEAATTAAEKITDAFSNIGSIVAGVEIPRLGSGGIVSRPTLALIGESGPEAVVPLGGGGGRFMDRPIVTQVFLDSYQIAEAVTRRQPEVLRRLGAT